MPSWYLPDGGGFFKDHAEALNHGDFTVDVLVNRVLGLTSHSLYQIRSSRKFRESIEGPLKIYRSGYLKWPFLEKTNLKGWVKRYLDIYNEYLERNGPPDIIIAHSTIWAGYVAAILKDEFGIPFILIEHRSRFARNVQAAQKMIREWYFPFLRTTLVKADRIVTVSPALDNQLIGISPGIKNKILTIPNLIDTDFFSLPPVKREIEPFIIISFGILEYVKGFDILIKAFSRLVHKYDREFFLRIGGRGKDFKKLKAIAKQEGVSDRVKLHGYVPREEVKREMQLANLFVLPSRFEAFGVVLIEAMATGCPVISTHSGGPPHIVKETDGILVKPDDVDELANAMERVYLDYDKYDPLQIRKDVVDNYATSVIRDSYHQLVREVLDGKSSAKK